MEPENGAENVNDINTNAIKYEMGKKMIVNMRKENEKSWRNYDFYVRIDHFHSMAESRRAKESERHIHMQWSVVQLTANNSVSHSIQSILFALQSGRMRELAVNYSMEYQNLVRLVRGDTIASA